MSNRPPPPPGFTLDDEDESGLPPPPPGFQLDAGPQPAPAPRQPMPPLTGTVTGAIDGDTLRTSSGQHVRLPVVDAPELKQQGWDRRGLPVPIGRQSLDATAAAITGTQARLDTPIGQSYGRYVAPVSIGDQDLGLRLAADGRVVTDPRFLPKDAQQRYSYLQAERLARQNGLGLHGTFHQTPAQFRADPNYQPSRETVAQFWDTPTPNAGLTADVEKGYLDISRTGTPEQMIAYAEAHGFKIDPESTRKFVDVRDRGSPINWVVNYGEAPKPLTDPGDGRVGSGVRGGANGILFNQLEELGAGVDTLGLTGNRENIWNSDRRLADIYSNNLAQNEAITGYDRAFHPYVYHGAELGGAFVVPMSTVRSASGLAKWGAAYGGLTGLGQEGTIPERLTSGVVGAGLGAATTILGTRALDAAAPLVGKGINRVFGREGGAAPEIDAPAFLDVPEPPPGFTVDAPTRTPDRIDIGPAEPFARFEPQPIDTAYPGPLPGGRDRDWLDIDSVPPPPTGFTLDMPGGRPWVDVGMPANDPARSIAMDGSALPSLSQDMPGRVPDYLFPPQAQRLTDPLSDARSAAIANDIAPRDVMPIASNEIGSVEEAAARDAGRYAQARPVDEQTALASRTVTSASGQPVAKRGPLDLNTWLRTQGGIRDQVGELRAMGIDNKPRDLDFARGEQRFGKLITDDGMSLDDAAFKAWEAGYMPGLERPDVNAFLDALDRTHTGAERFYHPDDLPEVAQFEGMRADRNMLEQQLADGPVQIDRSVPADDGAPFPPPEAYEEWPAGGPDFAGNIRLDKLDTPQDIKRALSTVNNRFGFDAATRGRVANAETERLAGDLGMTPEQLMARRRGQAFNAEEALAARQILAKSGNELVNLAKRVQGMETPGDDVLAQFSQALRRHAAIQEQVSGMTAEAGRTLQQFRMLADSRKVPGEVLGRLVDMNGGRGRLQDAAQTILDTIETEPGKFNPIIEKLSKPRWIDKAIELRYNMLLSGPQTHAANVISNTLTALGQIPEHAGAAAIGMGRRAFRGAERAADRVYPSELVSRGFGLLAGAKEGLGQFVRTLRTGETSDLVTKVETQADEVISGLKGKIIRTPSRLLSAEDELFKAMARKMELYGLADRQASAEMLRGDAKANRIADLVANPPDDMLARTFDYARYLTYQRPLSGIPLSASAMTNKHPTLKFIVPFVRTPTNLLKYAAERSPAAPLIKEWRADMMAGGARRDLAISKAVVGTGVALWMSDLAAQGLITGSPPDDPNKERLMRADGWQPNSVKIGDRYIAFNRLDPFALSISVAADLATRQDNMSPRQLENASGLLVASLIQSMGDKTWLSGLSDLFSMLSDPQRNLPSYLQNQGASLVIPTGLSQIARDIDPTRRITDSVAEEIQARTPGASSSLFAQRDVFGRPIEIDRLGPEAVSPITQTQRRNDPVVSEMLRLGAPATVFPKRRLVEGKWVEYTPAEYDRLQAKAGADAHAALTGLVQSPQWKTLTPESQLKAIKDTISDARRDARSEVLGEQAKRRSSGLRKALAIVTAPPPPPPGFSVDGEAGGVNVYADLQKAIPGIRFTSGFRTREYQEEMRRRGYRPAQNSQHLDGRSLDMLPPPGKSMDWLKGQVRERHPNASLSIHDGHLHATFPGYYGAPVLGGAKAAGLRNPNIGMPAPPPGFKLD